MLSKLLCQDSSCRHSPRKDQKATCFSINSMNRSNRTRAMQSLFFYPTAFFIFPASFQKASDHSWQKFIKGWLQLASSSGPPGFLMVPRCCHTSRLFNNNNLIVKEHDFDILRTRWCSSRDIKKFNNFTRFQTSCSIDTNISMNRDTSITNPPFCNCPARSSDLLPQVRCKCASICVIIHVKNLSDSVLHHGYLTFRKVWVLLKSNTYEEQ